MSDGLQPLSRTDCLARLASAQVGRVILTAGGLPTALPVTYALYGESIVFRTSDGSKLLAATRGDVVAFEVDEIDPDSRTGWSVIVTGVAREVTTVSEVTRLEELGFASWLREQPGHWVRISPGLISGRQLGEQPAHRVEPAVES